MFSPSEATGDGGNHGLEGRLRGLILNNGPAPSSEPTLPPHMLMRSKLDQQQYLARASEQSKSKDTVENNAQGQQTARKRRPNQAQRRQMSGAMNIPLESGAQFLPAYERGQSRFHQSQGNYQRHSAQRTQTPNFHQQHLSQQCQNHMYLPQSPPSIPQSPSNHFSVANEHHFQDPYSPNLAVTQQQGFGFRPNPQARQLYQPGQGQRPSGSFFYNAEDASTQSAYLDNLVREVAAGIEIAKPEINEKEAFRATVELACRDCIAQYEKDGLGNHKFNANSVELRCFGSMRSGFATKASDMDLALISPNSDPASDNVESLIPRMLEKTLLDRGLGARLLTRTRVPIIKLCEKPSEKLLQDLRFEREKWELGFMNIDDSEEPDDAGIAEEKALEGLNDQLLTYTEDGGKRKANNSRRRGKSNVDGVEDQCGLLMQMENQSLPDYYTLAKRQLRKLGGRDLLITGAELSEEECAILNDLCRAFIDGLLSKALSERLRKCQSNALLFDPSHPLVRRSLNGIWSQIEGENLVMAWESRPLPEATERGEHNCFELVKAWRVLQEKTGPLTETNIYNRQLYVAADKLKKISSLQLMFLEQSLHEEVFQYHTRAERLLNDLEQTDVGSIMPIVVSHYIYGINSPSIRQELQQQYRNRDTLGWVAFQHRVLQLAADYEKALLKGKVFDEADRPCIEEYISLLRTLFHGPPISLPCRLNPSHAALVAMIRTLPYPSTISQSRPRDRYKDHLDFPKNSVGIQCDINFSAHLALHNTLLLRCYSHCDPRVKPMILFIKHWAKTRGINTPYCGTLSSYGYVLMALHYLVNIAQPFVCPNLQEIRQAPPSDLSPAEIEAQTSCQGKDVRFWRNETEIRSLCNQRLLNHNDESTGALLRGFFEYYAQSGTLGNGSTGVIIRGFDWGREVISLRTMGGIRTKQDKGWVGARTTIETTVSAAPPVPHSSDAQTLDSAKAGHGDKGKRRVTEETKEIRHRYLFAIEDPFELDHNVARTVTHNGIVSIRDEMRRAWRIIKAVGTGRSGGGDKQGLLDEVEERNGVEKGKMDGSWTELLGLMHGDVENEMSMQRKEVVE